MKITFTHKLESDGKLNFLDMTLVRVGNMVQEGQCILQEFKYASNNTFKYKQNVMYNVVDRAIRRTSIIFIAKVKYKVLTIFK